MKNNNTLYLLPTPSGVFEAFSFKNPTDKQRSLQTLLSSQQSMSVDSWVNTYHQSWLDDFISAGHVQYVTQKLNAPHMPLDKFLPYVVASLSMNRRAAIGSSDGFCLARLGYSQEEAETLCVAGADFNDFLTRQRQRGWAINEQAVSFYQHVDLLIPTTSFVFLWIDDMGYSVVIDGEPLTNNRAFVELVWALKTSGLKFTT